MRTANYFKKIMIVIVFIIISNVKPDTLTFDSTEKDSPKYLITSKQLYEGKQRVLVITPTYIWFIGYPPFVGFNLNLGFRRYTNYFGILMGFGMSGERSSNRDYLAMWNGALVYYYEGLVNTHKIGFSPGASLGFHSLIKLGNHGESYIQGGGPRLKFRVGYKRIFFTIEYVGLIGQYGLLNILETGFQFWI
jgi:hypothetical protein